MSSQAGAHGVEWHTSVWPLLLSVGILFFVPLAFTFQFVYQNSLMAIISLGVGAPLTIASITGWVKEGLEDSHHYGEGHVVWAMPIFILAEALLFIGFFAAYWFLRFSAPSWPPQGTPEMSHTLPLIMTVILVSSSFTIHFAENKMEEGNNSGFIMWLIATIALGAVFLGFEAYEWAELIGEGFTTKTNIFSTSFYSITGFHGSHVLVGTATFLFILIPAFAGKINKHFVTAASMYWHFVDIVWLFVLSQIYFL